MSPLASLIPVFVDVETYVDDAVTIKKMTLRQYLKSSFLTTMAVAVGLDDDPTLFYTDKCPGPPGCDMVDDRLKLTLKRLATDPRFVFVAHNAAFDMRVLRAYLDVPHPINVWCSMEGAMGAWPECPGGYGLGNLSELLLPPERRKFHLPLGDLEHARQKIARRGPVGESDVSNDLWDVICAVVQAFKLPWDGKTLTDDFLTVVLGRYNQRDVTAMRDIYQREVELLCDEEQGVALRTHHQRRHLMLVDEGRRDAFVTSLNGAILEAQHEAGEYLEADQLTEVFNIQNGVASSVRYTRLKKVINAALTTGDSFASTSLKKLSPVLLARNPSAAALLTQTTRVGKMRSHQRRSQVFSGVTEADIELGYMRATTGRFSSPSVGRGLNCLAEGTPIPTKRGVVPIEEVAAGDVVWDGESWAKTAGAVFMGERTCIMVAGVMVTPDHLILCPDGQWRNAWDVLSSGALSPEPESAAEWYSGSHLRTITLEGESIIACTSAVTAETRQTCPESRSSTRSSARSAPFDAGTRRAKSSPETPYGRLPCPGGTTSKIVASTTITASSTGGADAGSPSATSGGIPALPSSSTCRPWKTTSPWPTEPTGRSTASTMTATTAPGTSVSPGLPRRSGTGSARSPISASPLRSSQLISGSRTPRSTSTSSKGTLRRVFDLVDCGPNNRFQAGDVLVHNCHNVPKHDVAIAKPVRQMFRLPPHLCFVRGDLANVENRVEALITGAPKGIAMFDPKVGGNIFADPYIMTWKTMTGALIKNKKDPIRQVAKGATLGLGFLMSSMGYSAVLLNTLADKRSKVTEETLKTLIIENRWQLPRNDAVLNIIKKLGCSQIVALAAYHVHRAFNEAFPEYGQTARWLVNVANAIAAGPDILGGLALDYANRKIDEAYTYSFHPDRALINVIPYLDDVSKRVNLRVGCGFWPHTLTWREPYNRVIDFGDKRKALTIRKASGEIKPFTPQLAIENVTQAAARNAMCMGVAALDKMGFRDVLHVHDEVMIITERKRESVLAARDALVTCFGPKHTMPWGWSILIKPDEITVTESLYEDEDDLADVWIDSEGAKQKGSWKPEKGELKTPGRWRAIEENLEGCLANLP